MIFTDKDISEFCLITGDPNRIHNPEYMATKGKKAIVPGMLTFVKLAAKYQYDLKTLNVNFNNPVCSENEMEIVHHHGTVNSISAYYNNKEIIKITHSSPLKSEEDNFEGIERTLEFSDNQLSDFFHMTDDLQNTEALFQIAYASKLMQEILSNPITEIEKEAVQRSKKGLLPVYESLKITIHNPDLFENSLVYKTNLEKTSKRDYLWRVRCCNSDNIVYDSEFKLKALPEKLIMRIAETL